MLSCHIIEALKFAPITTALALRATCRLLNEHFMYNLIGKWYRFYFEPDSVDVSEIVPFWNKVLRVRSPSIYVKLLEVTKQRSKRLNPLSMSYVNRCMNEHIIYDPIALGEAMLNHKHCYAHESIGTLIDKLIAMQRDELVVKLINHLRNVYGCLLDVTSTIPGVDISSPTVIDALNNRIMRDGYVVSSMYGAAIFNRVTDLLDYAVEHVSITDHDLLSLPAHMTAEQIDRIHIRFLYNDWRRTLRSYYNRSSIDNAIVRPNDYALLTYHSRHDMRFDRKEMFNYLQQAPAKLPLLTSFVCDKFLSIATPEELDHLAKHHLHTMIRVNNVEFIQALFSNSDVISTMSKRRLRRLRKISSDEVRSSINHYRQ